MPASEPDDAVVARLEGLVSGTYTLTAVGAGANLWRGKVTPDGPQLSVFCLTTGGPVHTPYVGVDKNLSVRTVQVRVRGELLKFKEAQVLAEAVRTRVHVPRAGYGGYARAKVTQPRARWLFLDENGADHFAMDVELYVSE